MAPRPNKDNGAKGFPQCAFGLLAGETKVSGFAVLRHVANDGVQSVCSTKKVRRHPGGNQRRHRGLDTASLAFNPYGEIGRQGLFDSGKEGQSSIIDSFIYSQEAALPTGLAAHLGDKAILAGASNSQSVNALTE